MKHILCFGGSFNPVHKAHFEIAKKALKQSQADECWFIPSLNNPFKLDDSSDFEIRCQCIEAMINGFDKFKVSRIEASLEIPSYTINTVKALQKSYPDFKFSFLIGSDQALKFEQWKDAKELLKLIDFYVYKREKKVDIPKVFKLIESTDIFDISSTEIREGNVSHLHYNVLRKMIEHEFHVENLAQSLVSEKRFKHIQAMTKLALGIASAHDMDTHQVYLAALFHDCAKEWPIEKLRKTLEVCDPKFLEKPEYMWHARCGAYYAKHVLQIQDKLVLQAITHHVEGLDHHPLSQLIYIADKCDETRGYDASKLIQIAYDNIENGYKAVVENTKNYYEGKS